MIISSQGFGHFQEGLNNQDFGLSTPRMLLVLDGCSGARFSELGTRLFAQLFSKKEEYDNVEKFEDNVKSVFDNLIEMMEKHYKNYEEFEKEFIMENLLFTIIACFETENEYIVKLFGDGYVVTQNANDCISFMKFSYGKCPPYFAYRYCKSLGTNSEFKTYGFKTFKFDKKKFPKIAIASDGISPIVKGEVSVSDKAITNGQQAIIDFTIKNNKSCFFDDITIATFGG